MHACVCVCVYECVHELACAHTNTHSHIHTHACNTHTRTHTHTRIYIFLNNNNNNNNNNHIERRNSRFVYNILTAPRTVSTRTLKWPGRNRVQIMCNTSSAYYVQHVVLHATLYEGTAQLLSLTELTLHLF